MVVGTKIEAEATDRLFQALADPTRRDLLRRCGGEEFSVTRLAQAYPVSFAAVQKHVAVLERAGLVSKRRSGREQLVSADREGLRRAQRALDRLEAAWSGRVERMSGLLAAEPTDPEQKTPPKGQHR